MSTVLITFSPAIEPEVRSREFEEPVERFLRRERLGHVTGGGTDRSRNESDVTLEIKNRARTLPLLENLLQELGAPPGTRVTALEEPRATVRQSSAGDVVLVPMDDDSTAACKVLLVPARLRRLGYIVLGVYGHYQPDMTLADLSHSPLGAIATLSLPIRTGAWRILGGAPLHPNEKSLYPGPDLSLEGVPIYFEASARRAIARLLERASAQSGAAAG